MEFLRPARPALPSHTEVATANGPVAVTVRVNARARSYRLSVSARGEAVLTLPKNGRWREAEAFLTRQTGWLTERMAKRQSPYAIAPSATIALRGEPVRLVSLEVVRGVVREVDGDDGLELHIPGGEQHMRRRLVDWLKEEARADLEAASNRHAQTLGVTIAAIKLRDQSSRWGSCSSARVLNFNWRLVLAPGFVLDYVAAHEVAHILEMNHRPVFWRTVERTLPDYSRGKAWLKAHGSTLMAL